MMKQDMVSVSVDAGKLRAIKRYMVKKDADLEQELSAQLQRLYEKYVPASVREYIDEELDEQAVTAPRRGGKEGQ